MTIERIGPGAHFARAVVHGGLVYLSGHVSSNPQGTVGDQTRDILAALDRDLAEAGTDKSKLLSVTIWLSDISTFDEMNVAWDAWVDHDHLPARATVEAQLADRVYKVEIGGIAAI